MNRFPNFHSHNVLNLRGIFFKNKKLGISKLFLKGCGGTLEGNSGGYELLPNENAVSGNNEPCVWIVKLISQNSHVQFTLENLDSDSSLILYPEISPSESTTLQSIR